MKVGINYWPFRNKEEYEGILWTVVCLKKKKVDNLKEMEKFLETHKLPKLIQEGMENPNSKETESAIKNLPTKKKKNSGPGKV